METGLLELVADRLKVVKSLLGNVGRFLWGGSKSAIKRCIFSVK